jgi:Mn2+/Fe2+ NRAMP family transporter
MKSFLGTFAISLILCYIILFFGGTLIFENFWAILVFVSLIIAILVTVLIHQETKIEELEARIKTLESKSEPKE